MEEGRIVIDIETQTYRFTPSAPINHQEAVSLAGGSVSGPYVVAHHNVGATDRASGERDCFLMVDWG